MNISPNILMAGLGIFLQKEKLLAISDLHIGYETALTKQGILLPKFHFKDLVEKIDDMIEETKPKKILINGDFKHEFGSITDEEWRNALKLIDYLRRNCEKLILIKGNHDKSVEPIAEKKQLTAVQTYIEGDVLFCHGDVIPDIPESVKTIIIGHEHPAVSVVEGVRVETFKCFLKGRWQDKELIVIPSMNLMTAGSDVTKERPLSPFLKDGFENFEVFVVADEVYDFGKIENLSNSTH